MPEGYLNKLALGSIPTPEVPDAFNSEPELSDAEKIEFLYSVAVKVDKVVTELAPQIGPLLEGVSKNPMLKMFLR